VAKPRGYVGYRADCGIVEAPLETDGAEGSKSVRNTDTEADIVAQLTPFFHQGSHGLTRFERHLHRPKRWIVNGDRIVEDYHHPVAGIAFKRPAVLDDDFANRCVVIVQQRHYVFWGGGFREARKAAQIAE